MRDDISRLGRKTATVKGTKQEKAGEDYDQEKA
jgi:hypothetical protein